MRDLYVFLLIASIVFSCTSEVSKVEEIAPEDRAIIDGNKHTVPTTYSYTGLIHARETSGYVTINDLEIRGSGGAGINVGDTNDKLNPGTLTGHFIIRNFFIYRIFRRAIEVSHAADTLVF